MAKSLRSKRKRMFRRIKRERYGVKELIRLKKMLGLPVTETAVVPSLNVIEYNLKRKPEIKEEPIEIKEENDLNGEINFSFSNDKIVVSVESSDEEEMEEEVSEQHQIKEDTEMDHSQKKVYDPKTMTDRFGNYPPWFTQKQIKKQAKKNRLKKKIVEKQKKLKAIAEKKSKKYKKGKSKKRKTKDEAVEMKDEAVETKDEAVETKDEAVETKDEAVETKDEAVETKNEAVETEDKAMETEDKAMEMKDKAVETKDEAVEMIGKKAEEMSEIVRHNSDEKPSIKMEPGNIKQDNQE